MTTSQSSQPTSRPASSSARIAPAGHAPRSTRLAVVAAAAAVTAWAGKAIAIGLSGGPGRSALEGPLFLIGMICFVVAVCSLATSAVGRRAWWAVAGAVAAALLVVTVGVVVSGLAVDALVPEGQWVWGELTLWAPALIALGLSLRHAARRSRSA